MAIIDNKILVVKFDKHCVTIAQKDDTNVTFGNHGRKLKSLMELALMSNVHILIFYQL